MVILHHADGSQMGGTWTIAAVVLYLYNYFIRDQRTAKQAVVTKMPQGKCITN